MKCPACNGDGWTLEPDHSPRCTGDKCASECPLPTQEQCPDCGGTGTEPEPTEEAGEEEDEEDNSCPDCQGTGIGYPPPDAKCWHCKGRGTKSKPRGGGR